MNDKRQIIYGSQGGGLGDNLQITPLFKYFTNSTIEIIDNNYGRDIAAVYEGLADIIFKERPILQEEAWKRYGDASKSKPLRNGALNYLTIFGIEDEVSPIPQVKLNKKGLEWADYFLRPYFNPIALVTYGRGVAEPDDDHAKFRLLNPSHWQYLINELSKRHTLLHFSRGKSLLKFKNCIEINFLNLWQLKHVFARIKKYLGVDTGSYHLMLAVGGIAHVLVPESSWDYQYYGPNWQYSPELWRKEQLCRVKYYKKDIEWKKVLDNLL